MFYGLYYFPPPFSESMYLLYLNQRVKPFPVHNQVKSALSFQCVLLTFIYKIRIAAIFHCCISTVQWFPFHFNSSDKNRLSCVQSGACFTSLRSGWRPRAPWCALGRPSEGCTWYWFPGRPTDDTVQTKCSESLHSELDFSEYGSVICLCFVSIFTFIYECVFIIAPIVSTSGNVGCSKGLKQLHYTEVQNTATSQPVTASETPYYPSRGRWGVSPALCSAGTTQIRSSVDIKAQLLWSIFNATSIAQG